MPPSASRALRAYSQSLVAPHGAAVFTLVLGIALIVAGLIGSDPVEANRIAVPLHYATPAEMAPESLARARPGTRQEYPAKVVEEEVRRGDTLSLIFGRVGVPQAVLQQVLDADGGGRSLQSLLPGQKMSFDFNEMGQLKEFRFRKSPLQTTAYSQLESGFKARSVIRTPEIRRTFRHAVVKRSMYEAGKEANLSGGMILELANVLGGVVDFALDPRVGDTFSVLFEEQFLDGEAVAEGAIIAAEYINNGRQHRAYRFVDSTGKPGYYSPDGESMRKAFLRAPLDFTRVSSNFNMRRLHPIANVIRPHRGVDYSAPTGTPVYASGDGRVTQSGYSRANGNYVFIAHDGSITTRYLHLHKRLVRIGQSVSQGQTLGTVGATGLATGPHLHYEFLVNGIHKNPRTELDKLPRARSLDRQEMARFKPLTAELASLLANYGRAWDIAIANGAEDSSR